MHADVVQAYPPAPPPVALRPLLPLPVFSATNKPAPPSGPAPVTLVSSSPHPSAGALPSLAASGASPAVTLHKQTPSTLSQNTEYVVVVL